MDVDPEFLVAWVQAELEAAGEPSALEARAQLDMDAAFEAGDELDEDDARSAAAAALAERRGLTAALREAAVGVGPVAVREARGAAERLERHPPKLFGGPPPCTAWLRAAPGAAARLAMMAERLRGDSGAMVAEIEGPLGGSPGCSVR
jgi:hypothetical protein